MTLARRIALRVAGFWLFTVKRYRIGDVVRTRTDALANALFDWARGCHFAPLWRVLRAALIQRDRHYRYTRGGP